MVKYNLLKIENDVYIYEYFPEGNKNKKGGVIELDINSKTIKIKTIAEEDSLRIITAKELNEQRESVNRWRKEDGMPLLTEEEWPIATEDEEWYYYGSHVVSVIWKDFENGTLQEQGQVAWG